MEWAVHIGSAGDARTHVNPADTARRETGSRLQPPVAMAAGLIERYFGEVAFTRCVYGNEFCENLIPSQSCLRAALDGANNSGLDFTLVTPYVTDAGLNALQPLFELLNDESREAEVVFNDWGVLNVLRRDYPRLIPVQGRLMNKSLRDPRIAGVYAAGEPHAQALVTLRRSSLDCESYTDLMRRMGVSWFELDNLPQGIDFSFAGSTARASVYVPFGFISTSRVCMAAGIHYPKSEKFQPGAPFQHECQTHLLEYTYTNSPFPNRDQKFLLKGNTYFYSQTEAMLCALFEQALQGLVARITFQPTLPQTWDGGME